MLILFGAACVGVLVEAFVPRDGPAPGRSSAVALRRPRSAALVDGRSCMAGDAARSPPAARSPSTGRRCSCRARSPVLGALSLLLIGERSLEPARSRSSPQAAVTAGIRRDRRAGRPPTRVQTEVFPLTLFALGGMMLFVAANDLLTMFVALEVFSLPLYLLCALARRRRLLSPGGGAQVLPARRVRLGVLPVRRGPDLRLRRQRRPRPTIHDGRRDAERQRRRCSTSAWRCSSSACCSRPPPRRSTSGRRTSTRARRRRSPRFMAACTKVAAFGALPAGALRRASTAPSGTSAR